MFQPSVPTAIGTRRWIQVLLSLLLVLTAAVPGVTLKAEPVAAAEVDSDGYFTENATWYRDFAPGTISPVEGTVEMTVRFDKPYSDFGAWYDFMFRLIPGQSGPGNTLYSVHMGPPTARPSGNTYDQPLTFFVKNGNGGTGAFAYAQPASIDYTIGEPFNLAFAWKLGAGGYVAIYKDGVELARTATSIDPVQEKFVPYEFMVERGSPYNVTNLEVSTRALTAAELETGTASFTEGADTSLLADITLGQPVQSERFVTPWQTTSGYSVVKPVFRSDKQVFYADEAAVYPVATVNFGSADKTYNVNVKAVKPDGTEAFVKTIPVVVPADGEYRVNELALPELDGLVGFWYLETTIGTGPADSVQYKNAVSKVPVDDSAVADGQYENYFGIHPDYKDSMAPWTKINASLARTWEDAQVLLWYNVESANGHYTWEHADQYVDAALDAEMDVLGVLGNPSDWNSTRPPVSGLPAVIQTNYEYKPDRYVPKDIQAQNGVLGDGEDWTDYVYQTMKRYAGKIKYYEIANEVNFLPPYLPASFSGTAEEYFHMLKIAHEQAQRVKSEYLTETGQELELYLSTSGFTPVGSPHADRQMILDALQEPYVGYYDIFNVHGYNGTATFKEDVLPAFNAAKLAHPDLQLWQGEFGTLNDTHPTIPAKLYGTVEKYMDFLAQGTERFIGFGSPADDTYITRHSLSPTEVFQTTAIFQQNIRKAQTYLGSYGGFANEALLSVKHKLLRTDGNYLSILAADRNELDITVGNADAIIRVEDNYGNEVPVGEGGVLYKKDALFIVSSEELEIAGVTSDTARPLVFNGDFERLTGDTMGGAGALTPDNWSMGWNRGIYGTNAYVTKIAPFQGANALEFNSNGAPGNRTFMYQSVSLTEPGTYALSAYIKKVQGGTDVQPELNIWDGQQDHQLAPVTLTGEYAYYALNYTIEEPTDIIINIGILSGNGILDIDKVSLEQVQESVEIEMDNSDATGVRLIGGTTTANAWDNTRTNTAAHKGNFALNLSNDGQARAVYTPAIPLSGLYDVYEFRHVTNGTTAAPFEIRHAWGTSKLTVNQAANGGHWNKIGSFPFEAGSAGSVTITNGFAAGTGFFVLADGIKLVRTGDLPPSFGNGDFERVSGGASAFSDWTVGDGAYGTGIRVNGTSPRQGAYAAEFQAGGAAGDKSNLVQTLAVLEPGTYTLSAYIKKLSGGSDVQPELTVSDGASDRSLGAVALTGQYTYYGRTVVVSEAMNVTIKAGIKSGAGIVAIDDISFVKVQDNAEIIMDNSDASGVVFSDASWSNGRLNATAYNGNFALNTTKNGQSTATYTPFIPAAGVYDVYEFHHFTGGATDVPFTVHSASGISQLAVEQTVAKGNKWNKIGTYPFLPGYGGKIVIANGNTTGNFVLADGIRLVRTGPYAPVESIEVSGGSGATVQQGANLALNAAVLPVDATDKSVLWSVAPGTGQATIGVASGVLTGVAAGTVTVTATAADGSGVQGQLEVTVAGLDHVTLTASRSLLKAGEHAEFTVAGTLTDGSPADLGQAVISYAADSPAVDIDGEGVATATSLAEGEVTITVNVTLGGGSIREAETTVVVDNTAPTAQVTYSGTTPTSGTVTATIVPSEPVTLTNNGGAEQHTFLYNGSFTFTFVDAAGHEGTATAVVGNIVALSAAKPGKPALTHNNGYDTGLQDGNYTVTMNLWYGDNGRVYRLYENDVLIDERILPDNAPNAQQVAVDVAGKKNGVYRYYAELTNAHGTTRSDELTVAVTQATPHKPVLSHNNWDGDGNFTVAMNLWWGTNGTTYRLYENGVLIDTQSLQEHTPNAQSAATAIAGKAAGTYVYYAELVNDAGATASETISVTVAGT